MTSFRYSRIITLLRKKGKYRSYHEVIIMYICICHAVKEGDTERYHLIGTSCGKCIQSIPEEEEKKK